MLDETHPYDNISTKSEGTIGRFQIRFEEAQEFVHLAARYHSLYPLWHHAQTSFLI